MSRCLLPVWLSAVVLVLVIPARASGAFADPRGRIAGPFGTGAGEVWLLLPRTTPRSIVVFAHGWKSFPPSRPLSWVEQFRPWLDHLLARGSAVVFPRYQLGGDQSGRTRVDSFRQGLARGFARLASARLPVVVAGYSYGGSLAFYYAADARRWGLPTPRAVFSVFPAGPIAGVPLPALPHAVRVLIQVGDRDSEAGRGGADAFWAWLAPHPSARKRFEVVHSGPALSATHAAPKLASPGARSVFWKPLDLLVAGARQSSARSRRRKTR